MKKTIFLICLFLMLTSGVCNAGGWSSDLTVEQVFTEGHTDLLVFYTTGGSNYTSGCSANNWIFSATTDARRSRAYATLLSALLSGKKIRLWYTDSCETWSYHQATTIMLVK